METPPRTESCGCTYDLLGMRLTACAMHANREAYDWLLGTPALSFRVLGHPRPAGSKTGFWNERQKRFLLRDASPKSAPWKRAVANVATVAKSRRRAVGLLVGPVGVRFEFFLPRAKSHFGAGRNAETLKADAPAWHLSRPDALKLARAAEDAMTAVVYYDDAQIVREMISKDYGPKPGVRIRIYPLGDCKWQ